MATKLFKRLFSYSRNDSGGRFELCRRDKGEIGKWLRRHEVIGDASSGRECRISTIDWCNFSKELCLEKESQPIGAWRRQNIVEIDQLDFTIFVCRQWLFIRSRIPTSPGYSSGFSVNLLKLPGMI